MASTTKVHERSLMENLSNTQLKHLRASALLRTPLSLENEDFFPDSLF